MLQKLLVSGLDDYRIVGVVVDRPTNQTEILGVPVVASLRTTAEYISKKWIDAVYIDCRSIDPQVHQLISDCREMAVPTLYHVRSISQEGMHQFVKKVDGTTVQAMQSSWGSFGRMGK